LFISLDEPIAPLEIYVAVKQPDLSWLKLPLYLEVCGYEIILPVEPEAMYINQEALAG